MLESVVIFYLLLFRGINAQGTTTESEENEETKSTKEVETTQTSTVTATETSTTESTKGLQTTLSTTSTALSKETTESTTSSTTSSTSVTEPSPSSSSSASTQSSTQRYTGAPIVIKRNIHDLILRLARYYATRRNVPPTVPPPPNDDKRPERPQTTGDGPNRVPNGPYSNQGTAEQHRPPVEDFVLSENRPDADEHRPHNQFQFQQFSALTNQGGLNGGPLSSVYTFNKAIRPSHSNNYDKNKLNNWYKKKSVSHNQRNSIRIEDKELNILKNRFSFVRNHSKEKNRYRRRY